MIRRFFWMENSDFPLVIITISTCLGALTYLVNTRRFKGFRIRPGVGGIIHLFGMKFHGLLT